MTHEIRYSYYDYPDDPDDTIIIYNDEQTIMIHEHEDNDIGLEVCLVLYPIDQAMRLVQNSLDVIEKETGWEQIAGQDAPFVDRFNHSSLIAWNNAMVENGIIPNYETEVNV